MTTARMVLILQLIINIIFFVFSSIGYSDIGFHFSIVAILIIENILFFLIYSKTIKQYNSNEWTILIVECYTLLKLLVYRFFVLSMSSIAYYSNIKNLPLVATILIYLFLDILFIKKISGHNKSIRLILLSTMLLLCAMLVINQNLLSGAQLTISHLCRFTLLSTIPTLLAYFLITPTTERQKKAKK